MTATSAAASNPARFQRLWRRCLTGTAEDQSAEVYGRLLAAYAEPQRVYHNLEHIQHCLDMFDASKSLMHNPDAVELAIWMHDVVYTPGAGDNEARSAEWYESVARDAHDLPLRQLVSRLIMATLHDGSSLQDGDAAYLVDIDLSSFALPWEDFLRDGRHLRLENSRLDDDDYYRNQVKFQKALLERERFYLSDYFFQHYEARARENLTRYFEKLDL